MILQRNPNFSLWSLLIGVMLFTAAGTAFGQETLPKIASIEIVGNKHISKDTILAAAKIKIGDTVDKALIEAVQSRILDTGYFGFESNGLIDKAVHITSDTKEGEARLRIEVMENPLIKKIEFLNAGPLHSEELQQIINTRPNSVFNPLLIAKDAIAIEKAYTKQGYIVAIESADISKDEEGILHFTLRVYRIVEIKLTGHKKVRSQVIMELFKVKPGDYYNVGQLLEARRDLFNSGYFEEISTAETTIGPGRIGLTLILTENWRLPKQPGVKKTKSNQKHRCILCEASHRLH